MIVMTVPGSTAGRAMAAEVGPLSDRRGQAHALLGLGTVRRERDEYAAADVDLTHALDIARSIGAAKHEARALAGLTR